MRRSAIIACLSFLASCGGSDSAGSSKEAEASTLATPDSSGGGGTRVTFTAAQVEHGGVRWSPAVTSEVVATVEVPGQLVPNEHRTARLGAPAEGRVIVLHVHPGDIVAKRRSTHNARERSRERCFIRPAEGYRRTHIPTCGRRFCSLGEGARRSSARHQGGITARCGTCCCRLRPRAGSRRAGRNRAGTSTRNTYATWSVDIERHDDDSLANGWSGAEP